MSPLPDRHAVVELALRDVRARPPVVSLDCDAPIIERDRDNDRCKVEGLAEIKADPCVGALELGGVHHGRRILEHVQPRVALLTGARGVVSGELPAPHRARLHGVPAALQRFQRRLTVSHAGIRLDPQVGVVELVGCIDAVDDRREVVVILLATENALTLAEILAVDAVVIGARRRDQDAQRLSALRSGRR